MKNIILPTLCALCVMSFAPSAFASDGGSSRATNSQEQMISAIPTSQKEISKAEQTLSNKNKPVTDSWQDNPNSFPY